MKSKEVGQRVKAFQDAKGLKQTDLAKLIDVRQSNISDMLYGYRDISKLVRALEREFDLPRGFFTEGINLEGEKQETRPHYLAWVEAGSLTDETIDGCIQQPVIKLMPKYDYTVQVRGDSMFPEYKSGDVVACLDVTKESFLQWGKIHVLSTKQGNLIKKIYPDGDKIKCESVNANFPPFSINKNEIFSIGLVVGAIRFE